MVLSVEVSWIEPIFFRVFVVICRFFFSPITHGNRVLHACLARVAPANFGFLASSRFWLSERW